MVIFHFAIPFGILLSRSFKRDIHKLVWLAAWLLLMRYVDLFWIIEPNFSKTLTVTVADIVVPSPSAVFGWLISSTTLAALPLLPAYDPSAAEVLQPAHHHGGA